MMYLAGILLFMRYFSCLDLHYIQTFSTFANSNGKKYMHGVCIQIVFFV